MPRIALGIEYQGANYSGWQRQLDQPSVQEAVEKALSMIADHPVSVICAGRTDAGVHACEQIIHFDTLSLRDAKAWTQGVNTYLPPDIRILWSKEVDEEFNARRSATSRRYFYMMTDRPTKPGIMHQTMTWVRGDLDVERMQAGASYLLGRHDFSAFRAAQCQSLSPVRTISHINISRTGKSLLLDITANAFLQHMVRNIVGTLIQVGLSKQAPLWVESVLENQDRRLAGVTAPPNGLYLAKVSYPSHYSLPTTSFTPWFQS